MRFDGEEKRHRRTAVLGVGPAAYRSAGLSEPIRNARVPDITRLDKLERSGKWRSQPS